MADRGHHTELPVQIRKGAHRVGTKPASEIKQPPIGPAYGTRDR